MAVLVVAEVSDEEHGGDAELVVCRGADAGAGVLAMAAWVAAEDAGDGGRAATVSVAEPASQGAEDFVAIPAPPRFPDLPARKGFVSTSGETLGELDPGSSHSSLSSSSGPPSWEDEASASRKSEALSSESRY